MSVTTGQGTRGNFTGSSICISAGIFGENFSLKMAELFRYKCLEQVKHQGHQGAGKTVLHVNTMDRWITGCNDDILLDTLILL